MKTIQILMSTYNGEKYLREQLDSVLEQDCEKNGIAEWKLLVRDDGSKDGTLTILEEYQTGYPEKIQVMRGENCGVIRSFFQLLQEADENADYYAFSDQDDYWMPDKLSCGIQGVEQAEGEAVPKLYCCRPKLVDEKLHALPENIYRPPVRVGFGNALIENVVTGCTIVMNRELRKIVVGSLPEFTVMHDRWLYLTASCFGTVIYDETPHICYRQHSGNVIGTNHGHLQELRERLAGFYGKRHDISRQTEEFIRIYGGLTETELKEYSSGGNAAECINLAKKLVEAKHSFTGRVRLVKSSRLFRQRKNDNRIFKLLILLGSY